MTASKQKKRGRTALILLLCLLVLCLAAGGTAYALLRQKVRAIQAGAEFNFSYTVTSPAAETPALYGVLQRARRRAPFPVSMRRASSSSP